MIMNLLNAKNSIDTRGIVFGATVLTCAITGAHFVAQRETITTNYATDSKGNIYSDEGVHIATRRDILDRLPTALYCTHKTHGSAATGWKGDKHGTIVGVLSWQRWSKHGRYTMYSLDVRMFDGSLWRGRVSSSSDAVTLRYVGE